jgi:nucleoside-diphosphate-sugar epimerase
MEKMPSKGPPRRVFLTGAFGGVGEWALRELLLKGCEVTCFDKQTPATKRKADRLSKTLHFTTIWGDLTDRASVMSALAACRPSAIAHVAAIIPPLSVINPDLAYRVNVGGMENLTSVAQILGGVERFVFVSSYSVHGPCNPNRDPAPWTGATPVNPQDDYTHQKVKAETILRASALPWCIVRLCGVMPLELGGMHPATQLFSLTLPYDRRSQGIDVRDAGLAVASAAVAEGVSGQAFDVGGPGSDWRQTAGILSAALASAIGMKPVPREAYRLPDPEVDESWYFENWVDTSASQAALNYQRYSRGDYLEELRRRLGFGRLIAGVLAGPIYRKQLKDSPYWGKPQTPDGRKWSVAAAEILKSWK